MALAAQRSLFGRSIKRTPSLFNHIRQRPPAVHIFTVCLLQLLSIDAVKAASAQPSEGEVTGARGGAYSLSWRPLPYSLLPSPEHCAAARRQQRPGEQAVSRRVCANSQVRRISRRKPSQPLLADAQIRLQDVRGPQC